MSYLLIVKRLELYLDLALYKMYIIIIRNAVWLCLGEDFHISLDRIETRDIEVALQHTKPSSRAHKDKYLSWQRDYESV